MNVTLSAYLVVLVRWWRVVVALPLIAVTLTATYLIVTPAQYDSSAVLFVSTPHDDEAAFYRGDLYAKERMVSYSALINSPDLAARVNDDIGLNMDPDTLSTSVSLAPIPGTVLLLLTASGETPNEAQTIAAAYVEELRRSVVTFEAVPGSLTPRAELVTVQPPTFSTDPSGFPAWMYLGGAGGAALVLGCLAAVLMSLVDGRLRRPEDAAEAVGAPVLTIFPASVPWREPDARLWASESARTLRTPLDRLAVQGSRAILVASAEDGAGKTGTALALARALADRASSVVVVDFDSLHSQLAEALDFSDSVTVRELVEQAHQHSAGSGRGGRYDIDEHSVVGWHGVAMIPFGAPEDNPGGTADSPELGQLFATLRRTFEWVIIDTAGTKGSSDAIRLAALSDAIVLVARTGRTTFAGLRRTAEELSAAGGTVAGVVFVDNARRPDRRVRGAENTAPPSDPEVKTRRARWNSAV